MRIVSPSKPNPDSSTAPHDRHLRAALARPIGELPGVGPARRRTLAARLGDEATLADALLELPTRLDNPTPVAPEPSEATGPIAVRFAAAGPPAAFGRRGRLLDGSAAGRAVRLRWFRAPPAPLLQRLTEGEHVLFGRIAEDAQGRVVLDHPRLLRHDAAARALPRYPGLAGTLAARLGAWVDAVHAAWPADADWLTPAKREALGLPAPADALAILHGRTTGDEAAARRRLALDEWVAFRLDLCAARAARQIAAPPVSPAPSRLVAALVRTLPFAPTASQLAAHAAIKADFVAGRRMSRLVNGDVGSGKTLVAALAAAEVIEGGSQVALVAPSESLAVQHAATLDAWLRPLGVEVGLLTGAVGRVARQTLLAQLAAGRVHLVVGTHAVLQPEVRFAALALVVLDEHHRFGVRQRLTLAAKAPGVHCLALTATPVPRSLSLALAGELDVSHLERRPDMGGNVATRVMADDRLDAVIDRLAETLAVGARAFWVLPSIDGTARSQGARARFSELEARLPGHAVLLTGRMDSAAQARALAAFRDGTRRLLVATTVVEVGIDVPDASIVVIEGAEQFGLAQLHQLRGRVGRAGQAAACVLLYRTPLTPAQASRLGLVRECTDGLALAEADLELRGEGELLGLRQSGGIGFRVIDWGRDRDWLTGLGDVHQAAALERFDPRWLFRDQSASTGGLVAG